MQYILEHSLLVKICKPVLFLSFFANKAVCVCVFYYTAVATNKTENVFNILGVVAAKFFH